MEEKKDRIIQLGMKGEREVRRRRRLNALFLGQSRQGGLKRISREKEPNLFNCFLSCLLLINETRSQEATRGPLLCLGQAHSNMGR